MKRLLVLAVAGFMALSCGTKNSASISGTFSGVNQDTLRLELISTKGRSIVDTVVTSKQGDFRFNVHLPSKSPTFYNILCKGGSIPVLVSPGEKVTINSMCNLIRNYTIEGSEDSKLLKEFNTLYNKGVESLDSLGKLYAQTPAGTENDARRNALAREYTQSYLKAKRAHIAFIVKNAASMAAVYALYQRLPNDEALFNGTEDRIYYRMVADSLGTKYPDSPHVIALLRDVKNQDDALALAQRVSQEQAANADLGHPEITLQDMANKTRKLSELNGQVILLAFWSPNDQNGPQMNLEMKELYDTFGAKGLAIYQVALAGQRADWVLAVQAQKLPWSNVMDPNGFEGTVAMSYNVAATPVNFLIDKQGKIAGRNLQGAALRNKITELTR